MMSGNDMALVKAIAKKSATSSCYHPAGSKTCAELLPALLMPENVGSSYLMSDSGITTEYFIEGAGKTIDQNDTVVVCNVGTVENPVIKFDLRQNFIDLSNYVEKEEGKGLSENDFTDEYKDKIDDTQSLISKTGSVNLLRIDCQAEAIDGVYFTPIWNPTNGNFEGVSVDGTNETDSPIYYKIGSISSKYGDELRISGSPTGYNYDTFGTGAVYHNTELGNFDFWLKSTDGAFSVDRNGIIDVVITVSAHYSFESQKLFKPMITDAEYKSREYVQYAKTNEELTKDVDKRVSIEVSQGLTNEEKTNARNNIGLGNVDNTSDADKPISTATQEALDELMDELEDTIQTLKDRTPRVLGVHIDKDANVTYIADAEGMTPAHMDYNSNKFDYGSFANEWFVKDCRPCLLHKDGYVVKYLNKDDFSKDVDGNTVPIDGGLTNVHVMIEFPKTWMKIVPSGSDSETADIYYSPIQVDADYKDFPYIDYLGRHKNKFYMPAYKGTNVDNVLMSLSDKQISDSLNASTERSYCKANGNGWDMIDIGKIMLINLLLVLLGKTTDMKTVFGQGIHTGGSQTLNIGFRTGVHNDKGMFYGTNSGSVSEGHYENMVKVFGIEGWWGFAWWRYLGEVLVNGVRRIKMCYGNEDGSSTWDYNLAGDGYVNIDAEPSGTSGSYISKMKFTILGMFAKGASGSSTTYYRAGFWFDKTITSVAVFGGLSGDGARVSPFYLALNAAASNAAWGVVSAALSYL